MYVMSFSTTVKEELCRVQSARECCAKAEFAAFLRMGGNLHIGARQSVAISVVTENAAVARKYYNMAKELFGLSVEIMVHKKQTLKKNSVYRLYMPMQERIVDVLALLGMANIWQAPTSPAPLVKNPCCRRHYLRGAFLGGGSISDPENAYHLEISCNSGEHRDFLIDLAQSFSLAPKKLERKGAYVLYLKESEQIVDFLNIVGAHQALLEFENTRIVKDLRNQVNRTVNCEMANVNRIADTGTRQYRALKLIEEQIGFAKLPANLQEIALLRLENPDMSLKDLGELLTPPLGKSGVNHRLRKLERIAQDLAGEEDLL